MPFTFRPSARERTPLLLGLVGPSGSGKTFSALRLAQGIQSVVGGSIAAADTESRRMLHYGSKFKFDYTEFGAPFGSDRYLEVIEAAVHHGARTVIVDSFSHEHEGPGGYLDFHEEEVRRLCLPTTQGGGGFNSEFAAQIPAWSKPSARRRRLINGLLQLNANFIFCFRAKEKIALRRVKKEGSNGRIYEKTEPVELGWQAIGGEEFVYEMTCRFLLPPGASGKPALDEDAMRTGVPKLPDDLAGIIVPGRQLDEDMGAQLAQWAQGDPPAALDPRLEQQLADFAVLARDEGEDAFRAAWKRVPRDDKRAIGEARYAKLLETAQESDKIAGRTPAAATA